MHALATALIASATEAKANRPASKRLSSFIDVVSRMSDGSRRVGNEAARRVILPSGTRGRTDPFTYPIA